MGVKHSTLKSFQYASNGLLTAIKNEPNLRIHVAIAAVALLAGGLLKLDTIEWIVLLLTIFLVIILELINTVLENLVNIVSPNFNEYAKKAKDISAAAVLVSAILSVVVGVVLFGPKLVSLF